MQMKTMVKRLSVLLMAVMMITCMTMVAFADEPAGEEGPVYQDGFYTTEINTEKELYGYVTDADGNITQKGFNYPKKDYDFPVTIQIKDGKIVDVAYPKKVTDIVANTSSDINYLMWAMDGHNVTEASYNYLAAAGKNYEKYHVNPPMNGKGMREQIIAKNGTDDIDTVTAATITSLAIKRSVDKSLEKAVKGEKDDPEPVLPGEDTTADVIPEDGVYMAGKVDCIGASVDTEVAPMILYVKDGKIIADMAVEQNPSSYPHIYAGTEPEALEAGEKAWYVPVNYDYGYVNSKGVNVPGSLYHNIPVKSLDKPLNFVMFASGSGNWFNRLITIDSASITKIPYGDYKADGFTFEGGSGKAELTCEKIHVTKKGITCDIAFSSSKFIKAVVDGVEYLPEIVDGKSVFTVPMNINGQTVISGTTTAMSSEQTIDYTCTVKFDAKVMESIPKVYQDGFYTTKVSTNKSTYGWKYAKDGSVQYGFSYPSKDYDLPVTIQIKGGKIVDVAYTQDPNEVMVNTSSDFNYLLWAMDGHLVNDTNYDYLADDGNYATYHLNPFPAKNGKGMREQIIAANGTNDVDTVTAATITSRAIIDSVDQSLEKAEKGQKDDPEPVLPTPDTSADIVPADGFYTAKGTCVGATLGEDKDIMLKVENGKITAQLLYIEQRQKTYPYIYAGTEEEALAAGESAWLRPEDYDYGYKYPGSVYKDVPIKSLDKPNHFVMYAGGSGNWFNRLITIDSSTLKKAADGSAEINAAEDALEEVMAKEGATAEEIKAAQDKAAAAVDAAMTKLADDKAAYTADSYNKVAEAAAAYKEAIAKEGATVADVKAAKASFDEAVANLTEMKANTMKASGSSKKFKAKAIKKKAKSFKAVTVKKAQGKVTYKVSASKKVKKALKFKNGKVTVKKGTKKGKYVMKVTVKAAGKGVYKPASKTVKVTVTVK